VVEVHVPELGTVIHAFLNMTGMKDIDNNRELFSDLSRELVRLDRNGRLLISNNMQSFSSNK
jgi:hypothetical protein